MMAYDDGYVLCVLHDGSPVREIHGKVSIPFYSEYKIRLKNKHNSLRAKAKVWIDGRKVSNLGDFILHPGETLDLERFLDNDLGKGNKFQFVPLTDSRVNDPTDSENGIIKVEFYRELQNVIHLNWKIPYFPQQPRSDREWDWFYYNPNNTWGKTAVEPVSFKSNFVSSGPTCDVNYLSSNNSSSGATVEGGVSNQKFVETTDFSTEVSPITLTLKLKAVNIEKVKVDEKPKIARIRYCANCGKRRPRRKDKFCSRCGTKY